MAAEGKLRESSSAMRMAVPIRRRSAQWQYGAWHMRDCLCARQPACFSLIESVMSVHLSVCPVGRSSVRPYVCMPVCQSVCLPVCIVDLSVCQSAILSVSLYVTCLTVCLSVCMFLFVCMHAFMYVCMDVRIYVCMYVCL